jgi:hypothetical protein
MRKNLSDLYQEYKIRHDEKLNIVSPHFIRVMTEIYHQRTYIRPKIKWSEV